MTGVSFLTALETDGSAAAAAATQCEIEYALDNQGGTLDVSAANIVGNAVQPDGSIEIATDTLLHVRLAAGVDWKYDSANPVELSNSAASGFYRLVSVDADERGVVIAATRAPDGTNINHSLVSHLLIGAASGSIHNKAVDNIIGNPPRIEG